MSPLSNDQKRALGIAARQAFDRMPREQREAWEAANDGFSGSKMFELWRHNQQKIATGCASMLQMRQEHFTALMLHWKLLGADVEAALGKPAAHALARHVTDGSRRARYLLDQALKERGLGLGYAIAICRTQNRCELDAASEKQLFRILYTVRNRRKPGAPAAAPQAVRSAPAQPARRVRIEPGVVEIPFDDANPF